MAVKRLTAAASMKKCHGQETRCIPVAIKHEGLEGVKGTKLTWQRCKLVVCGIQLSQSMTAAQLLQILAAIDQVMDLKCSPTRDDNSQPQKME